MEERGVAPREGKGNQVHRLAHAPPAQALTSGFQRALLAGSIFIFAAAIIGLRATNTRGEGEGETPAAQPA